MELRNNTVLITGGSSGIGFTLAKKLIDLGNTVIICGRSKDKLDHAQTILCSVHTFRCDVSQLEECYKLADYIKENFPLCNLLINNAAIVHKVNFWDEKEILAQAEQEIKTNLMAPIWLTKLLAPVLAKHLNAGIVNITSGLVYVPRTTYPIYNATKAALNSFTQVIRAQNTKDNLQLIEVLFPVVDTPWHKGVVPKMAISPDKAVEEMLSGLKKDIVEIRVGKVKLLCWLTRIAPKLAWKKINSL